MNLKKSLLTITIASSLALVSTIALAQSFPYERSVNNMGKVTKSQSDVPITRLSHMLLPTGWMMSYMDDGMRALVVSWSSSVNSKTQNWHDALREIGGKEHLVFLVDGAERHVYVTYPGYGRNPGVEIINSTSVVFQEDLVTQEIIRRAKANEMNFKRREIQEQLGQFHTQRSELAAQLNSLNEERARIESQMERLSLSTQEAISVVENAKRDSEIVAQAEVIQERQMTEANIASSADFVFFVRSGLVINDNARRFARDIGYDVLVIDQRVPVNCDWQQDIEYTITGRDSKHAFAEYVAPYGFKPNFSGAMVELIYSGNPDKFKGCS